MKIREAHCSSVNEKKLNFSSLFLYSVLRCLQIFKINLVLLISSQGKTMHTDKIPQYFGKDLESMSFAKNYHRWILAEFSPYLGQNIAEVGAGTGNFSILLLETNIRKLKAFEPSDNMFPLLKKTLSKDKRACVENNFFGRTITEEEHFDSVLYVNVLEHIEDDMSELIKAHDALVSGGHLLIFAPALPALYSNMDRQIGHFRRYTKKNLLKLVQN